MQQTTNGKQSQQPPSSPGQWSIQQIEEALSRPLPPGLLESKTLKDKRTGQTKTLHFISWNTAARILSKYAPGWEWRITAMNITIDRLYLIGELSIPTANGIIRRSATGNEATHRIDRDGNPAELAYGDPSSNAESMAFRRAAAKFGLALYLY